MFILLIITNFISNNDIVTDLKFYYDFIQFSIYIYIYIYLQARKNDTRYANKPNES